MRFDTVKRVLNRLVVRIALALVVDCSGSIPQHNTSEGAVSLVRGDQIMCLKTADIITKIAAGALITSSTRWPSDQANVEFSAAAGTEGYGVLPLDIVHADTASLDLSVSIVSVVVCPISRVTSIAAIVVKLNK